MDRELRKASFEAWLDMIKKCVNENHPKYRLFGGSGVEVVERWFTFEKFLHDMGPMPDIGFEVGRLDYRGNFERDNCCWRLSDCNLVLEQRPHRRDVA